MKLSSSSLSLLLLTAILGIQSVLAYPIGAGGCATGVAVGGSHLTNSPKKTGSLEDGGFQLVTNQNIKLITDLNITAINPSQTYLLNVIPNIGSSATFKGALIRVDGPGMYSITPDENAKEADACTALGVGGVTHTDRTAKTFFGSSFMTESIGEYKIEVTVVVQNNVTGSVYYYDQFVLTSFDETPIFPTITPVRGNETKSPTKAPVLSTPTSPVAAPVALPVATPVAANASPSLEPSSSDSRVPSVSDVPSIIPSIVPSMVPTEGSAPVSEPTGVPVAEPTGTPVKAPIKAPVAASVPSPVSADAPTSAAWITFQFGPLYGIGASTIAFIVMSALV